ncbi:hypothetical protein CCMA1212_002458 [Trichoderma ghanense]|uniref:SSCRP protein n=1 Tax=Trichoderma ghanense TaxID=65468 RepID=A0ABY2HDY3_9HYPO
MAGAPSKAWGNDAIVGKSLVCLAQGTMSKSPGCRSPACDAGTLKLARVTEDCVTEHRRDLLALAAEASNHGLAARQKGSTIINTSRSTSREMPALHVDAPKRTVMSLRSSREVRVELVTEEAKTPPRSSSVFTPEPPSPFPLWGRR